MEESRWAFCRYSVIEDFLSGRPYLERLTLIETPWFSLRLHRIRLPDHGRELHDHPWPFLSVVLRGWYDEEIPDSSGGTVTRVRRIRWVNWKSATDYHRVVRVPDRGVWTLFLTGQRWRRWTFLTRKGKVDAHEWLATRRAELAAEEASVGRGPLAHIGSAP